MKFSPSDYNRIVQVIADQNLDLDAFAFIKHKGWVHVYYKPSGEYFAFYLKKETHLDPETKQWVKNSYYKVKKSSGKILLAGDQQILLREFRGWIETLNSM